MNRRSRNFPTAGYYGAPKKSRAPLFLAIAGIAVVVLAVFLVFRACGGGCDDFYCESGQDLPEPEGFVRVTGIYERQEVPSGTAVEVTLPLDDSSSDARNLGFFDWVAETSTWNPLGPAILSDDGKTVSTTLEDPPPPIITVMRRESAAGHVAAYVGHNQPLHADAAQQATIVHTRDFAPASDGTITGEPSDPATVGIPAGRAVALYPVVFADASDPGVIAVLSGILSTAGSRSDHVQQILRVVLERNLAGIDISYFDLPASERTSFALFISELANGLRAQGKVLSVTLPAPLKSGDRIDEGAYDWAEIGRSADILKIWPYRDQSTYRRDMPAILTHLATIVQPSTKLVLTVSPYATEKSPDGIRTMRIIDAMRIATALSIEAGPDGSLTTGSTVNVTGVNIDEASGRSGVAWQAQTASVAFTYEQGGGRTVWIENTFSVGFKLEFIPKYSLGGVAVEDASGDIYLGNIWPALVPFITTGQPELAQPNPDDLVPVWSVSGGTMEGGQNGVMKWGTPAEPGSYTITLTLSDGVSFFENRVAVEVQARPPASNGTG